jgi:hypothetical protein
VKAITVYEAADGARFDKETECIAYEDLCLEVGSIMEKLKPRPDDAGCNFSNGTGFRQHSKESFLDAQRSLVKIARRFFNDKYSTPHFDHAEAAVFPVGHTMVSRFINEGCPRPVDRAWHRLGCFDKQFREWGQPYYAMNPDKGEQVSL